VGGLVGESVVLFTVEAHTHTNTHTHTHLIQKQDNKCITHAILHIYPTVITIRDSCMETIKVAGKGRLSLGTGYSILCCNALQTGRLLKTFDFYR
jgi:hypothetical protein